MCPEPGTTELTDAEKTRRLPWTVVHSATNAVFAIYTVFGSAFVLFLAEMGMGKARIGLLLSLLPFTGLLAPLVAPAVARAGVKRTFLVFWGTRKVVMSLMVLAPWILAHFGQGAAFAFVGGIILCFALCRAVAETAWYPWFQEVVPDAIRGRFGAITSIVTTLAMCLAAAAGSLVVGHYVGLGRFLVLIAVGVVFGVIAVWSAFYIPGGAPSPSPIPSVEHWTQTVLALRDRNFLRYLGVSGLTALGGAPLVTFVPLLAREQLGLQPGQVVLLDSASLLGGLVSCYLWGWSADRHGSKPVMAWALGLNALVAVGWLVAPRHSAWSNPVALAMAACGGLAAIGWTISSSRILYVSIVPRQRRMQYMSIYYAWMGLTGGVGALAAGAALEHLPALAAAGAAKFNPYVPVFLTCSLLAALAVLPLAKLRPDAPAQGAS
jgi:MFS family permease